MYIIYLLADIFLLNFLNFPLNLVLLVVSWGGGVFINSDWTIFIQLM